MPAPSMLKPYPQQRYTFEFRRKGWLVPQVYELLSSAGCSPSAYDGPEVLDFCLTAPWTYIQTATVEDGCGCSDEETLPGRIRGFLAQG